MVFAPSASPGGGPLSRAREPSAAGVGGSFPEVTAVSAGHHGPGGPAASDSGPRTNSCTGLAVGRMT